MFANQLAKYIQIYLNLLKIQMKKVINGCPYCGSKEGFEQKVVSQYNLYFGADGIPDGASDPADIGGWKYPRCIACGRKVIIEFMEANR